LIDRNARNNLAEAMRALATGLITNSEFEESRLPYSTKDTAIREVFSKGAWMLYSDLHEYRFADSNKLDDTTKTEIARWILFLKTELPYEWPINSVLQSTGMLLANLLTLGFARRFFVRRYCAHGDIGVWPFIKKSDYEAALKNPPYLNAQTPEPKTEN
jgi:hypothetical protein